MRLLSISRAAGCELARDIPAPDPRQMPLLRSGAKLSDRYARALAEAGIHAVWVNDALSEGIEPADLVPPHVRERAARGVSDALTGAREAFGRRQPLSPEVARDLASIVEQIAASVATHPGTALVLTDLAGADAYTHQHSIDVCALGLLLGKLLFDASGWEDDRGRHRVDGVDRRLLQLGLGLLLHDVGKLAVPAAILNKREPLTDEELAVVRTHSEMGADLLAGDAYSPVVRAIVREHHERWDGRGYPRGLAGERIHQLARIAAVADVYDAVTSERPYRPAQPPHVGVAVITGGAGTQFDPRVVEVFRRVVAPFPVGAEIALADGSVGVVAAVDADDPERPLVRFPAGERRVELGVEPLAA
ncbi:MAG TPA: HD domain-containing phosphohydrolase [Solirubrobacteraceae bacterium]